MSAGAELLGVRGWRALAENIAYNQGYDDRKLSPSNAG